MRRFYGGLVGNRTRGAVVPGAGLVAAALLAIAAAPAGATITPITSPHASAGAATAVQAAVIREFPLVTPWRPLDRREQVPVRAAHGNPVGIGRRCSGLPPFPARRCDVPRALDR